MKKHTNDPCYYDTLGVDEFASKSEIKKAFRKKVRSHASNTNARHFNHKIFKQAKECHPDKNLNSPERASNEFKVLSVAYEILSDAEKRSKYDAEIRKRRGLKKSFSRVSSSRRFMREAMREATNIGRQKHYKSTYASSAFRHESKESRASSSKYSETSETMSAAYKEFEENVDRIQARWRELRKEARKFRNIPDSPIPTTSSKEETLQTPSPPPPPPPPASSSSPSDSSTKTLTPISFHSRGNEDEDLPSSSFSFRNLSDHLNAKVRGVENIQRMKKHIRLLEKLKVDQKNMVDTQVKLCKERQEFWKQYNIKIGHEQKKRNALRRQFQEQAAKMEALRKRHERQRSTRRRFHI